jgi:hypothetical protein
MSTISDYNDAVVRQVETLRQQLTEAASAMFVGRLVRWEQTDLFGDLTGAWAQGRVTDVSWHFDAHFRAQGLYFQVGQTVAVRAARCTLVEPGRETP